MLDDQKINILIVDDNVNNLNVLAGMLSERNYKIRRAINGTIAIRSLQASKPDLILLDINLPDISGYQVCTQIRQEPKTSEIPIIFISALNDSLDKLKAYAVGGVDYISKPFERVEILTRIDHQLQLQISRSITIELRDPLERLVTCSQSLQQIYSKTLDSQAETCLQHIQTDSQYVTQTMQELNQKLQFKPVLD